MLSPCQTSRKVREAATEPQAAAWGQVPQNRTTLLECQTYRVQFQLSLAGGDPLTSRYNQLMPETAGYVLVGGKSSRFGQDKALLEWRGRPLAAHAARTVQSAAGSATLVGSAEKYQHLGYRVIPDPVDGFGPLAGLLAALDDSASEWNLVVACDMPYLTTEFLGFLIVRARESAADVLLPVGLDGMTEPLCAVYSLSARDKIRRAVDSGVHKMTRAFESLRIKRLLAKEYQKFNLDEKLFTNLNSPQDVSMEI